MVAYENSWLHLSYIFPINYTPHLLFNKDHLFVIAIFDFFKSPETRKKLERGECIAHDVFPASWDHWEAQINI